MVLFPPPQSQSCSRLISRTRTLNRDLDHKQVASVNVKASLEIVKFFLFHVLKVKKNKPPTYFIILIDLNFPV